MQRNPKGVKGSMTEKELKKLSRLELLELLLEVSSENHELKQRVEKLNNELETAKQLDQLSDTILQAKSMLKDINQMAVLSSCPDSVPAFGEEIAELSLTDEKIYQFLLWLFAKDQALLSALPSGLRSAIEERISNLME